MSVYIYSNASNQRLTTTDSPTFVNPILNNSSNHLSNIATSGATTTLTTSSPYIINFTGTMNQTCQLEDVTTLPQLGFGHLLINNSTGVITVNSSGGNLIQTLLPGTYLQLNCTALTGTTAASWTIQYLLNSTAPSLNNTGVTYTGDTVLNMPLMVFSYSSALLGDVFYQNLISVYLSSIANVGPTTINFGNVGAILNNIFPAFSATTSILCPSLCVIYSGTTGNLAINMPLLTTFTAPLLVYIEGGILLVNTALTVFSLPSLKILSSNLALTSSTSLITVNLPNLLLTQSITGTLNALTTFTLTNLQSINNAYTLTANSLTTLSMPALTSITGSFTPVGTSLSTISMPNLLTIGSTFSPTLAALTTLTLTSLTTITGAFGLVAATLTTLSLPALTTLGAGFSVTCALATTVTLTLLANITGAVACSFAALTTLSLPAIVSMSSTFAITAANLVTFSMGATLKSVGGNFTMTGMKLNQASVDGILVSLAALDGTGGTTAYSSHTVNLSGGTSSAPSATGLTAKATLVGRGCTVTTN